MKRINVVLTVIVMCCLLIGCENRVDESDKIFYDNTKMCAKLYREIVTNIPDVSDKLTDDDIVVLNRYLDSTSCSGSWVMLGKLYNESKLLADTPEKKRQLEIIKSSYCDTLGAFSDACMYFQLHKPSDDLADDIIERLTQRMAISSLLREKEELLRLSE